MQFELAKGEKTLTVTINDEILGSYVVRWRIADRKDGTASSGREFFIYRPDAFKRVYELIQTALEDDYEWVKGEEDMEIVILAFKRPSSSGWATVSRAVGVVSAKGGVCKNAE